MATRRRAAPRRSRRRGLSLPRIALPSIGPEVGRSIVGIVLLVVGAFTLVALVLPGQGRLTDWWIGSVGPWFGSLRWLLPFLLLGAGWYVEWGPGRQPASGWGITIVGIAIAYLGLLGAVQIAPLGEISGGRLGRFFEDLLVSPLTAPGAFVLLVAIGAVGLMLAFNLPLRELVKPGTTLARWLGEAAAASIRREPRPGTDEAGGRGRGAAAGSATAAGGDRNGGGRPGRAGRAGVAASASAGQTGIWGEDHGDHIPSAVPSAIPTSATFAPARNGEAASATIVAPARLVRALDDITSASDSPPTRDRIDYVLPPLDLLDAAIEPVGLANEDALHRRNEEIIVRKLASFDIQAQIVGRNAGPVVTQYEVQPAPHVKVSRIEGLADDLAMALAARSLRIEAPIPGKSAVGIEVPNKDFNIVALRGILEQVELGGAGTSKLTFALGRDVAGKAQAVDLAKMPHLLIAGATGSGKSVMVNALITSLLCNAKPDEVRMILMDLKRVELAAYNGLPHLLVPVITEPERAKAALKWAVNEMEGRYRRFAGASSRNIRAYNETRVDPDDRMPYIVIVVDELADLMMREGKNVEDPIVRLAQKARATGIHMVLATQRPSVNVVTGLIKANFPSRIAFAMASQIDSRTILDAPGA